MRFLRFTIAPILMLCAIGLQAQLTADFNYTASCAGEPTSFVDASTGPGTAVSWYWNFGDGSYSTDQNPVHTYAAAGTYNVYFVVQEGAPGWDSAGVSKTVIIPADCDSLNRIEGNIYFDDNNNGTFDGADVAYGGRMVQATPGPYFGISDASGDYHIYIPTGTFTVEATAPDLMAVSEPAGGTYSVTFASVGDTDTGNDFGFGATSSVDDLTVNMGSGIPPRPGLAYETHVSYTNSGTTVLNGTISITPDPLGTFSYAIPSASSIGATIDFDYTGLLPGQSGTYLIVYDVATSATIGDALTTSADGSFSSDANPSDNVASMTDSVVNSWDPNDILVSPAGVGPTGDIPMETEWLTYTIRFQNTGTASAIDIVLEDQMDASHFDFTTFQMITATHDYEFTVADGDVFTWTFEGINLPDSGTNMLESNGLVQFRIKLNPGLAEGTAINNTAAIFFDFNPPVITNTATVTLREMSTFAGNIQILEELTLFPNPATESLTLDFNLEEAMDAQIAVMDVQGRTVSQLVSTQYPAGNNRLSFDVSDLNPGMYLIQIRTENGMQSIPWIRSN